MSDPTRPPGDAVPPQTSQTCPSCGWPNRAGSQRCEFCTAPLTRAAAPPRPKLVECPHCGRTSVGLGPGSRCQHCGKDYLTPPAPARRAGVLLADLLARLRQSWHTVLIVGFVAVSALYMGIYQRGAGKMTTADHVRQIKQRLEIFEGEMGGFPGTFAALGERHGPLPAFVLHDAWGREIGYTASRPLGSSSESGQALFAECEVRSAGANGRLGDDDDVVWNGIASGR